MAEREQVTILATLVDRFSRPLTVLGRGLKIVLTTVTALTRVAASPFSLLARGITGLVRSLTSLQGILVAGSAVQILRVFGQFEENMAQVATLVDTTIVNVGMLGDGLREIAIKTGDGLDSLTKGLFDAISAGVAIEDSLEFLDAAARLGAGGGTTTAVAIDGLTTILNAYGLGADKAKEVTDSLFKAMEGGKTTIEELASSVGIVAKTANVLGLEIDELTGAMSALTKGGLSTGLATSNLNSLLVSILAPTDAAREAARKYGIDLSTTALRAKGLVGFLAEVSEKIGDNDVAYQQIFPNQRAFRAAVILGSEGAKLLGDQMALMADKAGATDRAFAKVSDTLFAKLRVVRNLLYSFFIEIGQAAKPFLDEVIGDESKGTGLQGFLRSLADSPNRIRAVITAIAGILTRVVDVVREVFKNADVGTIIVNSFAAGLEAVVRTYLSAVPLLLRTVGFIGEELARGLIRSFVAKSTEELATALGRASGSSGFFADLIARAGLGSETVDRLTSLGKEINQLQEGYDRAVDAINTQLGIGSDKTIALVDETASVVKTIRTNTVEGIREALAALEEPEDGLRPINLNADALEEFRSSFVQTIVAEAEKFRQAKLELVQALAGEEDAFDTGFQDSVSDLQSSASNFVGSAQQILNDATARLGEGLREPTRESLKNLLDFIGEEIPRLYAEAGIQDAAQEATDRTTKAVAKQIEQLGSLIPPESVGAPELGGGLSPEDAAISLKNLKEGAQQFFGVFDRGITVGAALAGQFASGISGLVDAFTQANFSWSQFARNFIISIGKMLIQIALFRALSGAFGGGVGSGGGDTGFTPVSADSGSLSAGFNSGGWIDLAGHIHRFNRGTEIVPGPRSERRDMVRALLAPGEAVINRDATDYYSARFMALLNNRQIDRSKLFAAIGNTTGTAAKTVTHRFNSGGFAASASSSGASADSVPGMTPVLPVNEELARQILQNGRRVFFNFLRDNATEANSALGRNARGFS